MLQKGHDTLCPDDPVSSIFAGKAPSPTPNQPLESLGRSKSKSGSQSEFRFQSQCGLLRLPPGGRGRATRGVPNILPLAMFLLVLSYHPPTDWAWAIQRNGLLPACAVHRCGSRLLAVVGEHLADRERSFINQARAKVARGGCRLCPQGSPRKPSASPDQRQRTGSGVAPGPASTCTKPGASALKVFTGVLAPSSWGISALRVEIPWRRRQRSRPERETAGWMNSGLPPAGHRATATTSCAHCSAA